MDEEIFLDDSVFEEAINEDESVRSTSLLEDSFSSYIGILEGPAGTSTPRGRGKGRGGTQRSSTSQAKSQWKERLPCPHCTNTYANERTLAVHQKMHAMKSASARTPSCEELQGIVQMALLDILGKMKSDVELGELSIQLNLYCSRLEEHLKSDNVQAKAFVDSLSSSFFKIIKTQNSLLPSGFRSALYIQINKLLNSVTFRNEVKQKLAATEETSDDILNLFIGTIFLKLSDSIIISVLRKMRGNSDSSSSVQKRSSEDPESMEFKQLIYHIGGSVVNGLMWKGMKQTSSETWKIYCDLLRCKFLQQTVTANESSTTEMAEISSFTAHKNRGGLKFLNEEAFEFFATVFHLTMELETSEGSVPIELVDENVLKNDTVLCQWDALVGSELTEEKSIDLLVKTVTCCARIVSKGVLNRRLNEELKKAYSSVALRSRLSR